MGTSIALYLHRYPAHSKLIGDMLLGYADMESFAIELVSHAIGGHDTAVKLLYRLRGAEDRLNIADAVLRPHMQRIGLLGPYGQWLGAMRRCKAIRNQYAHCAWDEDDGELRFADLFETAQAVDDKARFLPRPITLTLLQEQHDYFDFAFDIMFYLMAESRFRLDRRRRHKRKLPKSRAAPSLHS